MPGFEHIKYLFWLAVLPLLVALFLYALNRKQRAVARIGDRNLVKLLTANYNSFAYLIKFILPVFSIVCLIFALSNLRSSTGSEKITRNGIDIMIALDVSKSMLAQDLKPSRIDRAKQLLNRLVDKLDNDRIGIVVFAGKSYLQMPLTGDHVAAKMYLSAASTESVPTQGTAISDALKLCYSSFNTKEKKYKSILLISDGEDHEEGALKTAGQLAQEGVVIFTIGMGSPQGSAIIDDATNQLKTDLQGNTVITKLNEEALMKIAEEGNGKYQLFQNTDAVVNNLVRELSSLDERKVTDDSLVKYESYSPYFLLAALFLLLGELFISENKQKKYQPLKSTFKGIFFLALLTSSARAQTENALIRNGNEQYKMGDFGKAAGSYEKVLRRNAANAIAQFNRGNALYKAGKKGEAIQSYEKSSNLFSTAEQKSNALHNKGVVLQNDNRLPECIAAYKNALKLLPENEDARQNLQKALQEQQQQQQRNERKDQDKQKNQDKQNEPKPQPSRLSKKDAEEKLKALLQQEKNLQDKLHKVNEAVVNKPEKDW
jgi:Ca-activated chloride channel family protein